MAQRIVDGFALLLMLKLVWESGVRTVPCLKTDLAFVTSEPGLEVGSNVGPNCTDREYELFTCLDILVADLHPGGEESDSMECSVAIVLYHNTEHTYDLDLEYGFL